jgi:hypothetical protein
MKISEIYEVKQGIPQKPNMKPMNNLVAKHAHKFNKGGAHPSKKDYNRKTKHKKIDTDAY